jgi:ADP-ribose pyrophosphatase YjhB (NUDIX family)
LNPPGPDLSRFDHLSDYKVAQHIRPLALCIFRRDDGRVLVAPGYDPVKQKRFCRPLGGEIEFGERAEDAARREIREELGADVEDLQFLGAIENVFTYLGQPGHELVWLYEGRLSDPSLYTRDVIEADEGGATFEAHWVDLAVFVRGEAPLYPDGLLELLVKRSDTS